MKQKIFISGASRGIGLSIAQIFYQHDFEVIICSRSAEKLALAKEQMPDIHTFVCDISNKAAVKKLAAQINEQFGALEVLVNNGGIFLPGQIHSEEDEVYEKLMQTNMDSAYYFSKALLPAMIERKQGTIFNMCSVASIIAYPSGGSYGISKFALLGFSKALREEMKPYHIRVISVLPGAVMTDSWSGVDLPEARFIPPEDIAQLIWTAYNMSPRTVVEEILVRPALGDI